MKTIYLNGEYVAESEAKISITDRSYLFGEGLFETLRSYNQGHFPFLKKHLQRMEWSATFLNLPLLDDLNIEEILTTLLKKNQLQDAKFKIVLSQNHETSERNLAIFCDPLPESVRFYQLKTIKLLANDCTALAALKSTNYLVKILARRDAKDTGFDDGILLNSKGLVTEATSGNLFWVDEAGILKTVAEGHGLLRGVTRGVLLDLIKEKSLVCREDQVAPHELSSAREVFLTNSILGVVPVIKIDHRQISGGETGSITAMVSDLLKQKIKTLCELQ